MCNSCPSKLACHPHLCAAGTVSCREIIKKITLLFPPFLFMYCRGNNTSSVLLPSLLGNSGIKDDWNAISGHTMAAIHSEVMCKEVKEGGRQTFTAAECVVLKVHDIPASPIAWAEWPVWPIVSGLLSLYLSDMQSKLSASCLSVKVLQRL